MEIAKKLYVGFQKERYSTDETQRLLGFAIPISNTKAFEKRKETVERWRDKTIPTIEIDNVPRNGFKIVDTVTRYRTNNKLFRVLDPAGFELEISAENLFQIINECGIMRGWISDPMIWAGGRLISTNSEEYKQHLAPKATTSAHDAGKWMKHKSGTIFYRYEGRFFYIGLGISTERNEPQKAYYYHRDFGVNKYKDVTTDVTYIVDRTNDKSVIVYTQWNVQKDGSLKQEPDSIHIRRSYFKDLFDIEPNDPIVENYEFPIGEPLEEKMTNSTIDIGEGYPRSSQFILYKKREETFVPQFSLEGLKSSMRNVLWHDPIYYGKITYKFKDLK